MLLEFGTAVCADYSKAQLVAVLMSLGIVIKGPEGVVLASDTRVTLTRDTGTGQPPIHVNFDNASKMLSLDGDSGRVAAVTQGNSTVGGRTAHSLLPEFRHALGDHSYTVEQYANELSSFFVDRWARSGETNGSIEFIVGGIDVDSAYGEVYRFRVPNSATPVKHHHGDSFGMSWGGQLGIVNRLVQGFAPGIPAAVARFHPEIDAVQLNETLRAQNEWVVPYDSLPLQDCVDLAIFLIRTTITAQNLSVGIRGVGGTIEVVTITPTEGVRWVQRREIHGERP